MYRVSHQIQAQPSQAAGWTHEAVLLHRIGVEPHSISVGTARIDCVESLITVHASAPKEEPTAEHIVETDLDVPSGELTMSSPAVSDGPTLTVPVGLYRARVSYVPSTPPAADIHEEAPGDHFLYRIDLWPADQPHELVVLRQGVDPWAG